MFITRRAFSGMITYVSAFVFALALLPAHAEAQGKITEINGFGENAVRMAQGDTPFGVNFNLSKKFDATLEDMVEFFDHAQALGDTVMLVWRWNKPDEFERVRALAQMAHNRGMKLIIQISNTAQGTTFRVLAPEGFEPTFNDPATRARYIADVLRVAELKPIWLNVSPELNLVNYFSNEEYEAYSTLYLETYAAVKALHPNMKVGVSYLDGLFIRLEQYDLPDLLGPRDFIGITTYPDGRFDLPTDVPLDWYLQVREAFPDDEIIISEVGWGSFTSSLQTQADFVSMLPQFMAGVNPTVVMWALMYETDNFCAECLPPEAVEFLESLGVDPVELFSKLNSIGLIARDGTPKPAYYEALNLDFSGP